MLTDIVYAADRQFFFPLLVSLHSLLAHSIGQNLNIHLVTGDIDEAEVGIISSLVEKFNASFHLHRISEDVFLDKYGASVQSKATCYRYLIPRLLAANRAIYIDGDTLIRGSLEELLTFPVSGGFYIAGVEDRYLLKDKEHLKTIFNDCDNVTYINAGVMIMNLAKMREDGICEAMLKLDEHSDFRYRDQDVLNLSCQQAIVIIDSKWNVTTEEAGNIQGGIIRHYTGAEKPWLLPFWHKRAKEYWNAVRELKEQHIDVMPLEVFDWVPYMAAQFFIIRASSRSLLKRFNLTEFIAEVDFPVRYYSEDRIKNRDCFINNIFTIHSVLLACKCKQWKKFLSIVYSWTCLIGKLPTKWSSRICWRLFGLGLASRV